MSLKPTMRNILLPAGWCFGSVAFIRRFLYRKNILKSHEPPIPTVTIGNIAVGGTGKTPHSQYVIDFLKDEFKIAFLSRGYGRKSKGFLLTSVLPENEISAQTFGDEPFMIFLRNKDIPVAVDADRYDGIVHLLDKNPDTEAVILDDAFQHLKLKSGLSIIITEYERPYFRDYPMPAGRLREFRCAADYSDMVIVSKTPDGTVPDVELWRKQLKLRENQALFFTKICYQKPEAVTDAAAEADLKSGDEVVVFSGIANPEPLKKHLGSHYSIKREFNFPDHHVFSDKELKMISDYCVNQAKGCVLMTTEKDWARLQTENNRNIVSLLPIFVVKIGIEFLDDEQKNRFNNILSDYVRRKNKKNRSDN